VPITFAGPPPNNRTLWHILVDNCTRRDNSVGADGYTGHNDRLVTDEYIVTNIHFTDGIDANFQRLLDHIDRTVVTEYRTASQMDIVSDARVIWTGKLNVTLNAASFPNAVEAAVSFLISGPSVPIRFANCGVEPA